MNLSMTLGERLRSAREAQNLTREQLADKVGYPVRCVIAWEEDRVTPYQSTMELLCEILRISVTDILKPEEISLLPDSTPLQMISDNSVNYQADTSPAPIEATADDFWNLPEGVYAELIDNMLYFRNTPVTIHQILVGELFYQLKSYIKSKGGSCIVLPAPFAVNLNADDKTILEPDVLVICNRDKLNRYEYKGAPDFVIEVVSENRRRMDYSIKQEKYAEAGVREYWIVDPKKRCTTVYHYEEDFAPAIIPFDQPVRVGIFGDLHICVKDLIGEDIDLFM